MNLNNRTGKLFYEELAREQGASAKAQGYRKPATQEAHFLGFYRWLKGFLPDGADYTLLDYGGGTGDLYLYLKSKGLAPIQYTVVDTNDDLLAIAASRRRSNAINCTGDQHGIDRLNQCRTSFDVVACIGMFNYFEGTQGQFDRDVLTVMKQLDYFGSKGFYLTVLSPFADYLEGYNRTLGFKKAMKYLHCFGDRLTLDQSEAAHWMGLGVWKTPSLLALTGEESSWDDLPEWRQS